MELLSNFLGLCDSEDYLPIYTLSNNQMTDLDQSLYSVDQLNQTADSIKLSDLSFSDLSFDSMFKNLNIEETDCVLFDDFGSSVIDFYSGGQIDENYDGEYLDESSDELREISKILSVSDTLSDFQLLLPFEQSEHHIAETYLVPDVDLNVCVLEQYG